MMPYSLTLQILGAGAVLGLSMLMIVGAAYAFVVLAPRALGAWRETRLQNLDVVSKPGGIMKMLAALLLLPCLAHAAPYFRVIDPTKPQISAGVFVDPTDPGNSSVGSMLALVTHSTRDGCLMPSITCEDWVPLSVGFAEKNGKAIFAVGPSINLAPLAKSLLLRGFNAVTESGSYSGVKSSLGSESLDRQDISVSFGPTLAVAPLEAWKGYLRVFLGAAWKF